MRRVFATLCMLLCATSLSAQSAHAYLDELETSLGGRYAFTIAVQVGDAEDMLYGRVMVDGDSYYMSLEGMEVYSDGKLRYEINNERREVTEDRVDLSSHDLLTNPTRAFQFAPEEFDMSLRFSQNDEVAVVELRPRDEALGITSIALAMVSDDSDRLRPRQLLYNYDGESVVISFEEYAFAEWSLPRWDEDDYKTYDIVSFL